MPERRDQLGRAVHLEYSFDRLFALKLEQAYAALVPDHKRRLGEPAHPTGAPGDENRSDLRQGFWRPAERRTDDREPDGGADRVRQRARVQRAGRVDHHR